MARSRKNDLVVLPTARASYGVVLLSHGAPDPRARLANDLLSRRVGHRLNAAVSLASLDHDKARLDGAVAHLQERDISEIVVVPSCSMSPTTRRLTSPNKQRRFRSATRESNCALPAQSALTRSCSRVWTRCSRHRGFGPMPRPVSCWPPPDRRMNQHGHVTPRLHWSGVHTGGAGQQLPSPQVRDPALPMPSRPCASRG